MTETLSHWINGRAVAGQSGRRGDVFNPAIGEKIAEVPLASADEVGEAVASARAAFVDWSA
ncbi:MAG: putative 3-oxopropanoate dehydrogenase, partial [Alphaproteobacteria bacterium MarineAlpha10_Bin1]